MHSDHDDVTRHFGKIWPVHVEEFGQLLVALRRQFRGDLDMMLVLALIGSRTLPPGRLEMLNYADFAAGRRSGLEPRSINVQSIAACSGIPRETVRRKVLALEGEGWIERRDGGYLIATEKAARDLAPATDATVHYLARLGAVCVAVVQQDLETLHGGN